jgi:acyl carrier protein
MDSDEQRYLDTVRKIVFPDEPFDMNSKWAELGADSLDLVELCMQVEELFGVMIDESELAPIETVGQLYRLALHHRSEGISWEAELP